MAREDMSWVGKAAAAVKDHVTERMVPEIGAELKQMAAHGAHEMSAALFNGSAFVMYPRGTREDNGVHGPQQEGQQHQEQGQGYEEQGQQHERNGRDR